jgi:hypothetical protein
VGFVVLLSSSISRIKKSVNGDDRDDRDNMSNLKPNSYPHLLIWEVYEGASEEEAARE